MEDGDNIIIGGGLAGSAAAIVLARAGRHVILLEKTSAPHHKVCGEFLSVEAQESLAVLGVNIWSLGAEPIKKLRIVSGASQSTAPLPFKAAGLSRYMLDEALLNSAKKQGAEIRRGVNVTRLRQSNTGIVIEAGNQQIQAGNTILATGKHEVHGLRRNIGRMTAQKMQIKLPEHRNGLLDDTVQLALFEGGYIGACFVEKKIVTLCWTLDSKLLKAIGGSWPAMQEFFARQSPMLSGLMAEAMPQYEKPVATSGIPYGYLRHKVIAPEIYPVGDQLAVIPSFTGDGTAIALQTGMEAARAILETRNAESFQQDMIARLKPQFRWAGAANLFFTNRFARHAGMKIAQVLPGFMTAIASATRLRSISVSSST